MYLSVCDLSFICSVYGLQGGPECLWSEFGDFPWHFSPSVVCHVSLAFGWALCKVIWQILHWILFKAPALLTEKMMVLQLGQMENQDTLAQKNEEMDMAEVICGSDLPGWKSQHSTESVLSTGEGCNEYLEETLSWPWKSWNLDESCHTSSSFPLPLDQHQQGLLHMVHVPSSAKLWCLLSACAVMVIASNTAIQSDPFQSSSYSHGWQG